MSLAEKIHQWVEAVVEPDAGLMLSEIGATIAVTDRADLLEVRITLPYAALLSKDSLTQAVKNQLAEGLPNQPVHIEILYKVRALRPKQATSVAGVKNIIAVASGKGGVGKSTTAVHLALALNAEGARVGLLDADVYGPSLPLMFDLQVKPVTDAENRIEPLQALGLQLSSIGFLIAQDAPAVWRGPMATAAVTQLLRQTAWRSLDYLIVDFPPGTGDIPLTLAQRAPLSGALMVTTPQKLAVADTRKSLNLFNKLQVPVLGVVENMAVYVCSHCGHLETPFGSGGGESLAQEYQLPFLGRLPLHPQFAAVAFGREEQPCIWMSEPDGAVAQMYGKIARKLAVALAVRARATAAFPTFELAQPKGNGAQ